MRNGSIGFAVWLAIGGAAGVEAAQSPYAAVSGVVLNDATGTPLRRAVITLVTADPPHFEAVTFTESNGAFGFTAIPPGNYRLRAEVNGFERAWFGASDPRRPPGTLKLAAGDYRYGITFRLRPLGSISGTVLDADGDPVPNVQVRLLQSTWRRLKPAYANEGATRTDDRGQYHLNEVVPGEYIVMVMQLNEAIATTSEVTVGQPANEKMYAAQFYPDASRPSEAAPLQIGAGETREGIDFHLAPRAVARLHGTVVLPHDVTRSRGVRIAVYPQQLPDGSNQAGAHTGTRGGNEFEIPNLVAGPYVVEARLDGAERDYSAVERVELPPGGLELTLRLEPDADVNGRVDLEGAERPEEGLRVALISGGDPPGYRRRDAVVKPDGTFSIQNVQPGIWDISVQPVPPGGYIKSMRLGDQDVLTEDMTIRWDTHDPLHIVVSARGGVVTGTVTVPKGLARSPRASVLLAPDGKFADVLSFYRHAYADDSGHFEIKGITPGRYKLYAFEELDPAAFEDPGFLKPYEPRGQAFDVAEGAHVDRETELIPVEQQAPQR
ncbi:MAG TPA: carboxypeptidase regulatory-like domain-containing protein [Bryobacteraceae bacterium]|nr:carboxypeptidase regulatory-like domain-containing protein [Bryobacteraceae bacterium]